MIGKVLYGALFVVAIPLVLVVWARVLDGRLTLPIYGGPWLAGACLALGAVAVVLAWHALWVHGRGLPMNAYPPKIFVTRSIYAVLPHPIYTGFTLAVLGASMALRSPSGLWVLTPFVALGSVALLWGYELPDLDRRFGARPRAWLSSPEDAARAPTVAERISAMLVTVGPFCVLYELVTVLGAPPDATETYLSFERGWPVVLASYPFYASTYVASLLSAWAPRSSAELRRYVLRAWVSLALVIPMFFFLPFIVPPRPFESVTVLGRALLFERAADSPGGALPSYHVVWAFLAASTLARRWPKMRAVCTLWAVAVATSCVLTGMHSVADVAAGRVAAVLVLRWEEVWEGMRRASERVANSWREWRFGPVRVISHGAYAGLATAVGVGIVAWLSGSIGATLFTCFAGLVGAGLWAQYVEGSPALLRPYGFYGGLLGIVAATLAAPLFGLSPWILLGAYSVAGPWVQSLGRLRCLVQGCCHGAPSSARVGIRYVHERSRVVRLSPFAGQPVHPTPLYSILGNVFIALVVGRLHALRAPLPFVCGVYMVLGGFARFVEERYRGETQTPMHRKLRLYQWIALAQVVVGVGVSMMPGPRPLEARFSVGLLPWALFAGVVSAVALGVDFPGSKRRFSRLT